MIPADPFPGTIGVAPSRRVRRAIRGREDEVASRVGLDLSELSPPPVAAAAADGLGTLRRARSEESRHSPPLASVASALARPCAWCAAVARRHPLRPGRGRGLWLGDRDRRPLTFRVDVASAPPGLRASRPLRPQRNRSALLRDNRHLDHGRRAQRAPRPRVVGEASAARARRLPRRDVRVRSRGRLRLASVAAELRILRSSTCRTRSFRHPPLDIFERYQPP